MDGKYSLTTSRDNGYTNRAHTLRASTEMVGVLLYLSNLRHNDQVNFKNMSLELNIAVRKLEKLTWMCYKAKTIDLILKRTKSGRVTFIKNDKPKPAFCLGRCGKYLSFTGFCSIQCKKHYEQFINLPEQ